MSLRGHVTWTMMWVAAPPGVVRSCSLDPVTEITYAWGTQYNTFCAIFLVNIFNVGSFLPFHLTNMSLLSFSFNQFLNTQLISDILQRVTGSIDILVLPTSAASHSQLQHVCHSLHVSCHSMSLDLGTFGLSPSAARMFLSHSSPGLLRPKPCLPVRGCFSGPRRLRYFSLSSGLHHILGLLYPCPSAPLSGFPFRLAAPSE